MEIFNYLKKRDKIDIFIKTTGRPGNMKKRYCPVQNGTYGQPIHTALAIKSDRFSKES
jgi:hypothetical protein